MSNFYRPLARPGGSSDRLVLTSVSLHEGAVLSRRSKVRVQVVQLGASPIRLVGVWLAAGQRRIDASRLDRECFGVGWDAGHGSSSAYREGLWRR